MQLTNYQPAESYAVIPPNDYLQDFAYEAKRAKKRVWVQAMYLQPGKIATTVSEILTSAAQKVIDTKLHIDWFGLLKSADSSTLFSNSLSEEKKQMFDNLRKNGVDVLFTNQPNAIERYIPYFGRNHMKITIVDDIAYIGGVNFADIDFSFADFMVKITDIKIVSAIADQFMNVHTNSISDVVISISDETKLIIDRGTHGKSIILDNALDAVNNAKISIHHTNQMIPDGRFLQALHKAKKRGVQLNVIVPVDNTFSHVFSMLYKINKFSMILKGQQIPCLVYPKMLHAKLTIIDGKTVIFGSNNLLAKGILAGTAEIALLSENKVLVGNLITFFNQLKAGSI
jgi:cardiolipin synthase